MASTPSALSVKLGKFEEGGLRLGKARKILQMAYCFSKFVYKM